MEVVEVVVVVVCSQRGDGRRSVIVGIKHQEKSAHFHSRRGVCVLVVLKDGQLRPSIDESRIQILH